MIQSIGKLIVCAIITQLCNFVVAVIMNIQQRVLKIDFGNQMKTTFPGLASQRRLEPNAWETQLVFQRLWTIKLTSAALWAFYFSSPRSRRYRSHSHQNSHHVLVFRHCLSRTIAECWVLAPAAFSGNRLRTPKLTSPIISPKPRALRSLFRWLSFFSNRAMTLPETMNHFPPSPPA